MFFAWSLSSNAKDALVKIIEKPMFLLGFSMFLLIDDSSQSIENNRKDACKTSQNLSLIDDTISESKMLPK